MTVLGDVIQYLFVVDHPTETLSQFQGDLIPETPFVAGDRDKAVVKAWFAGRARPIRKVAGLRQQHLSLYHPSSAEALTGSLWIHDSLLESGSLVVYSTPDFMSGREKSAAHLIRKLVRDGADFRCGGRPVRPDFG
jgi:hypothetical protein